CSRVAKTTGHDTRPALSAPSATHGVRIPHVLESSMKVRPVTVPLKGTTRVPGDKSVTHRAVMFASIAEGTSTIRGGGRGEDNYSTMAVMRQLGASVTEQPDGTVVVEGVGLRGLHEPSEPLDCGNSGTTARLLVGLLAGAGIEATLTGDASLSVR